MSDIGNLATVVERLAALGPSRTRGPHCWFCGKIEAWFFCDCPEARDAQQGRRARPRFDAKLGAMILDEEIIRRNLAWGFGRRYVPAGASVSAGQSNDANSEPVVSVPVSVAESNGSNAPVTVSVAVTFDRKAYQRELMRKRRAAAKRAE